MKFISCLVMFLGLFVSAQAQQTIDLADVIRRAPQMPLPPASADVTAVVRPCSPKPCTTDTLYQYPMAAFTSLFGFQPSNAPAGRAAGDVFLADAIRTAPAVPPPGLAPGDVILVVTSAGLRKYPIGDALAKMAQVFPTTATAGAQPRAGNISLATVIADAPDLGRALAPGDLGMAATPLGIRRYPADQLHNATVEDDSEVPGPSKYLFRNHFYACEHNYYVAVNGSASNDGLTANTPWSLDAAVDRDNNGAGFTNGSCINLAPGKYERHEVIEILSGGTGPATPTGFVVWRCTNMPFTWDDSGIHGNGSPEACILRGEEPFQGYYMSLAANNLPCTTTNQLDRQPCTGFQNLLISRSSWVVFDGLEVDGNIDPPRSFVNPVVNFGCMEFSKSGWEPQIGQVFDVVSMGHNKGVRNYRPGPYPRNLGRDLNTPVIHHGIMINNVAHGCGWGGMHFEWGGYAGIFHNVVYDTAGCWIMGDVGAPPAGCRGSYVGFSWCCGSAIHPYQALNVAGYVPTTLDDKLFGWNNQIYAFNFGYNVVWHTRNDPRSNAWDGNGIQIDDFAVSQNGGCPALMPLATPGTCPFTGKVLILRNILLDNGGAGSEIFEGGAAEGWYVQNTSYGNSQVNTGKYALYADRFSGTWLGNIVVSTTAANTIQVAGFPFGGWVAHNVSWPAGRIDATGGLAQFNVEQAPLLRGDPNPLVVRNLALQPASPARGINAPGYPIDFGGACLPSLEKCP